MAFKMKGFSGFKSVSPMRNSNNPSSADYVAPGPSNNDDEKTTPPTVETGEDENQDQSTAGDFTDIIGGTSSTNVGDSVGDKYDKEKEQEKLKKQSKKEMYANAWQSSGVGHLVEAGKSIGRGIKNFRDKKSAKRTQKLTDAETAVGSGTETLKQAKLVDKANRKAKIKEKREKGKSDRDKKKLAKYKDKRSKKRIKEFKKNTVVIGGKTYDKE